jgi:hypothetical protein
MWFVEWLCITIVNFLCITIVHTVAYSRDMTFLISYVDLNQLCLFFFGVGGIK